MARLWFWCCALGALGCDEVVLEFSEFGIDGLEQVDQVNEAAVCKEGEPTPPLDASAFVVGPECEAFPQGCDGELSKCTVVNAEDDRLYRSACVTATGSRSGGECCERRARGLDDCAAGNWCTPLGVGGLDGPMVCRVLCISTEACSDGERCLSLSPGLGICAPQCEVLAGDCSGDRMRCTPGRGTDDTYFGFCSRYGSGTDGEPCASDADCGQTLVCEESERVCRELCNAERACPEERRCLPLGLGDPNSPRVCLP